MARFYGPCEQQSTNNQACSKHLNHLIYIRGSQLGFKHALNDAPLLTLSAYHVRHPVFVKVSQFVVHINTLLKHYD